MKHLLTCLLLIFSVVNLSAQQASPDTILPFPSIVRDDNGTNIEVIDIYTGTILTTIQTAPCVSAQLFSPDRRYLLYSESEHNSLPHSYQLFDLNVGESIQTFSVGIIGRSVWSDDSQQFIFSTRDGSLYHFDLSTQTLSDITNDMFTGYIYQLAWRMDNFFMMTRHNNQITTAMWDGISYTTVMSLDNENIAYSEIFLSPTSTHLLYQSQNRATEDVSYQIFDLVSNESQFLTISLAIVNPIWHPDGTQIAFVTLDEQIVIYDLVTNQSTIVKNVDAERNPLFTWSPDGRFLIYGDFRGGGTYDNLYQVYAYDFSTGNAQLITQYLRAHSQYYFEWLDETTLLYLFDDARMSPLTDVQTDEVVIFDLETHQQLITQTVNKDYSPLCGVG